MTTKVLSVASEVFPLVKTGGLADVAGALPLALAELDVETLTMMPAYPSVKEMAGPILARHPLGELFGGPAEVLRVHVHGLEVLLLDAPHLFDRPGGPYITPGGYDHPDNWARFAALSQAAASVALGAIPGHRPDIVHSHDWQAALAPVYLAFAGGARPKTVLTIHNLAFQGNYPYEVFPELGLPDSAWAIDGVEYYGHVGYLKGGIHAADAVTTVSPTYAREILTEGGGMGLGGLLRGSVHRLLGIVNGIDVETWDPRTDPDVAATYSSRRLATRRDNKRALELEFGLPQKDGPILAVVSRLTWQKGIDLLVPILDDIVAMGARVAIVGSGEPAIEAALRAAQARHPHRIGLRLGYDETISHRVQAGADALLIPSRFEPCGLTQLYGLRYGCIPIVSRVGGLADTVIDANFAAVTAGVATGIVFSPVDSVHLLQAVERAVALYRDPTAWQRLQLRGMATDVSWSGSAKRYADLYRGLLQR
ncbi:glycogen synthase GlgA [Consotaella aegiceratis]|uniref:glycogen synthase GlgA n=1 Tax=Consotaella aegiceratis TaxID=3097961 RepID=UPI002F416794